MLDGRNISLNRDTSPACPWLSGLDMKITITGTMRLDRKGIPAKMKTLADREEKSVKYCYNEANNTIMMVSYVDRKKKKAVVVLTTMHDNLLISWDQRKKPSVFCIMTTPKVVWTP